LAIGTRKAIAKQQAPFRAHSGLTDSSAIRFDHIHRARILPDPTKDHRPNSTSTCADLVVA